jgi:uncharacterized protein YxjI
VTLPFPPGDGSQSAPSLLDRRRLVLQQRAKLFEMRTQFRVLDEAGAPIGSVEQLGRSPLVQLLRFGSDLDVALPVTFELRDTAGAAVLVLRKPWFRRAITVTGPDGSAAGTITKQLRLGKARFVLAGPSGEDLGAVVAENWRARDFSIRGPDGAEVARVRKTWEGLAKALLTDADNYVVELSETLRGPQRSLAVAAAVAIDTILKQKDD